MTQPEFLERDVMLFLHDQALREYGGIQGIKDEGLLDSALGRPRNKLAYADPPGPDLFDLAAAYAFGLASNHAFNVGMHSERLGVVHWPDRLSDWLADGGWLRPGGGTKPTPGNY